MLSLFLTIVDGGLVLETPTGRHPIPDLLALTRLTGGKNFLVSSSVDFPAEYTTDPEVIALAHTIRAREF